MDASGFLDRELSYEVNERMPKKSQISRSSRLKSKIRPVERTSISDEIVEQLTGLISRGVLKPGERLPSEKELCLKFGVGRTTIRTV